MHIEHAIRSSAQGLRVAVVVSGYHSEITFAMRDAAVQCFLEAGGARESIEVAEAPGAFELIALCAAYARHGGFDAVVAIGCIITGQTPHDRYLASAVSIGIAHAVVETGVPISFGVLTCLSVEQARERSGAPGSGQINKGEEAMIAAIGAARALRSIGESSGVRV